MAPAQSVLRQILLVAAAVSAAGAFPAPAPAAPPAGEGLKLTKVAGGLSSPLQVTAPRGDARLFIVEQTGRVRILRGGQVLGRPFLDLRDRLTAGGERGLLSLAFHPRYGENGLLFVNYTDKAGHTRVERFKVSADPDVADAGSGRLILRIEQPFSNHNGGHIFFAPDGMLWVATGDGGSGGDPLGNGQNRGTLLGKMLRLDVDGREPYGIPRDNPFVGVQGVRPEIWAWGLRNPWRCWIDATEGLVYIADVGQNEWEEVNVAPVRAGGLNYGWNTMEASECYRSRDCDRRGLTLPVAEYRHGEGCSVTGGLVYRGRRIPAIAGHYFYSDYCRGWVRSFRYRDGRATDPRQWKLQVTEAVTSFGEDGQGEMYLVSGDGAVYRFDPAR